MVKEAVLFDIDGTLVDSNECHVLAWEQAFAAFGYRFARGAIHGQLGKGSDMLIPSLLPASKPALREELARKHGEIYKEHYLNEVKPFPRAYALLEHVRNAGQKVVLASSASDDEVDHYLELLGVEAIIWAVTTAGDVQHTKPAPDIFAAALGKAGTAPEAAIVVGDTPYDMEAARKCGVDSIALRSGKFSDDMLAQAGPVAIYDSVAALLDGYDNSPLSNHCRVSGAGAVRMG
jgi:HAD superfamily hydrolase (TIGR01509 family)